MKIYIASSRYNIDEVRYWMSMLRAAGHEITFDWTPSCEHATNEFPPGAEAMAIDDALGVKDCDLLWIIVPAIGGVGCFFEMGAAYAWEKRIVISGDGIDRTIFRTLCERTELHNADAFEYITR